MRADRSFSMIARCGAARYTPSPAMKETCVTVAHESIPREITAPGRWIVEATDLSPSPEGALLVFAEESAPAALESLRPTAGGGGYSIYACQPVDRVVHCASCGGCPFRRLAARVAQYPLISAAETPMPLPGGWIGWFGYESGLCIESLVSDKPLALSQPLARFSLYDATAVYDHDHEQWFAAAVEWPMPFALRRPSVGARLAGVRARLARAGARDASVWPDAPVPTGVSIDFPDGLYLKAAARSLEYIAAGDVYQVNLARRYRLRTTADSLSVYRRLRRESPAPYAAYLAWGQSAVMSSSPELFLELRGDRVVTRPIKGTRARGAGPEADAVLRHELSTSQKDRAELNMIVDLLRNDLGRVCCYGSIRVVSSGDIETHPTVFHRVATIEGRLGAGRDWLDLLLATFPGGSVTGAPKIRAMQIIDELEPSPRGAYCGALGVIGLDGRMTLNLAIRTMVQRRDELTIHAGGGIVADSTPESELAEIEVKSAAMLRAAGCAVHPDATVGNGFR